MELTVKNTEGDQIKTERERQRERDNQQRSRVTKRMRQRVDRGRWRLTEDNSFILHF